MKNEIEAQFLDINKDELRAKQFGSVDTTNEYYYGVEPDIVNRHIPKILFEMEPPEWARERRA